MSGVGVSGLIANLPATVTPYPTQDPALELGGYRSVPNAAARDAIPANFRAIGMQVTLQDTGVSYQLVGGILNANWQPGGGAPQPFVGAYYVNSAFTGVQTGSQSNPFTTAAAAFAFAASVGVANGVVFLNRAHTENIVFPVAGNWELAGINDAGQSTVSLTGTVDVTCTAVARRSIRDLTISGAVTGNAPTGGAASRFRATNVFFFSSLTLTASGTGFWRCQLVGGVPGGQSGSGGFVAACSVNGSIAASFFEFDALVTMTGLGIQHNFYGCLFTTLGFAFSQTGNTAIYANCTFSGGTGMTSSAGSQTLLFDGASLSQYLGVIPVVTGTFVVRSLTGNNSVRTTVTNNVGVTTLTTGGTPAGQYTITMTLTVLVAGTLGTAVGNVQYTDLLGVVQTRALGAGINITGTGEFSSSLTFCCTGGVSYSVGGIVTPGALSLSVAVNVRAEY